MIFNCGAMVEIIFPAVGTVFQPEVTKPQVSLVALGSSIIRNRAYCGLDAGNVARNEVMTFLSTYLPLTSLLAVPVLPATS